MTSLLLLFQDEHAHHMDWTPTGPDPVSLFNHHVSGWLVVGLALFAYLEQTKLVRFLWVKYGWPFILLLQSMFTLIWSDNAQFWPFELQRWARHWVAWQHKIFAFLALALAAIEFLRRRGTLKHPAWPHILNALIIGAGIFLWFHQGHHTPVIHREHQMMSIEIFTPRRREDNHRYTKPPDVAAPLRSAAAVPGPRASVGILCGITPCGCSARTISMEWQGVASNESRFLPHPNC